MRVSSTTNAGASATLRVFGRVTRIVPSLIAQGSGTQVMVTGRNLGQASQVHFDGQPSGGLAVMDAQTVVASAPVGARSGPVVVRQSGAAPDARSYRFVVVSD